jgi:hypothetical protein
MLVTVHYRVLSIDKDASQKSHGTSSTSLSAAVPVDTRMGLGLGTQARPARELNFAKGLSHDEAG